MALQDLNALDNQALKEALFMCCGSSKWVERLSVLFPFPKEDQLFNEAEQIWYDLEERDWLEAFSHHPKIGDTNALREKFASTAQWASGEQAGVNHTSEIVLNELAEANHFYEQKFGYIFIICATGKSAEEMLDSLRARLQNPPDLEMKIAMGEQNKITRIRLEKLLAA
ncbi:2-oxo-4-hydroxy-4-carboxy-5-ureidoimidazoline decarboxylase [Adhaeribacter soli]|uniref:2-oxo-4-hydroxy-4-carboxy-5-ureidoimidazoline decarboxylase n=1 Tax=Adhaeribacter soli TaxID=2607655 RepID=A0A5N1J3Q2_9BACT|nr:2-oxo-4-hydroxy-4-carboxy-5-ureidoimidazoline decarboxylase [Adhaeribacter soli]KAA9345526.1 2-oxo-4-hydroxy-4-carboxy-5-ureidoimidazoline decarboxylase [Adhaeribacter soli]